MNSSLERFGSKYTPRHIDLARLCALPVALTPELIHLIRYQLTPDLPYSAESELLLSSLCEEAGPGLYEMRKDIRKELLEELRGRTDLQEEGRRVAHLLAEYARTPLAWAARGDTEEKRYASLVASQQFAAFAWLAPDQARRWLELARDKDELELGRSWFVAMEREIPNRPLKVFVSVPARVAQNKKALLRAEQEIFGAFANHSTIHLFGFDSPVEKRRISNPSEYVRTCDIAILFGERGGIIAGSGVEKEFLAAREAGIPRILYVFGSPNQAIQPNQSPALESDLLVRSWQEMTDIEGLVWDDLTAFQCESWPASESLRSSVLETMSSLPSLQPALGGLQQFVYQFRSEELLALSLSIALLPLRDEKRSAEVAYLLLRQQPAQQLAPSLFQEAQRLIQLLLVKKEEPVFRETLAKIGALGGYEVPFLPPRTLAEYKAQMVSVPAGRFRMGSESSKWNDQRPVHEVELSAFHLGRTPVTVGMWQEYCAVTKRKMPEAPRWGWQVDHPIVSVSWEDCKVYADWAGLALPTEAQWEYGVRGSKNLVYPWGNDWDASKCVNASNSGNSPAVVGSNDADHSWCGALDMAGNVWEWCVDWFDPRYYKVSPLKDPLGPRKGTYKVLRGGSWNYSIPVYFRSTFRSNEMPLNQLSTLGFRLCS